MARTTNNYPWKIEPALRDEVRAFFYAPSFPSNPTLEEIFAVLLDQDIDLYSNPDELKALALRAHDQNRRSPMLDMYKKMLSTLIDDHVEARIAERVTAEQPKRNKKHPKNTPVSAKNGTSQRRASQQTNPVTR